MQNVIDLILRQRVVAIMRRIYGDDLYNLVGALADGGMKLVEVTFDQGDADCLAKTPHAIAELDRRFGGRMMVGAGTVLNPAQVDAAAGAGAKFIISPNVSADVIRRTKELGLVSMPGAMTPTELLTAHDLGADFVKVFPYVDLGIGYLKSILAPINHIRFVATGGVTDADLPKLFDIGFAGAGISIWLSEQKLIEEGNFAEFTRRAKIISDIVAAYS